MKKIVLILVIFLIFINVQALELNSKYIYVYNDTEDKAMYELNAKEEIKVASMTKIMTAIIVIENNKDLDEYITIKDEDLRDIYVYTNVGFQAGQEVTIKELLYGILLKSGSDAVNAAVRVTAGAEENFIDLMNQKVKELNLKNTYFSNAIGKDKDNYSSVHDIAKIMEYCLKNKIFKEIISTDMHYIDRLNIQINGPLYKMDEKYDIDMSLINGGKSGYTGLAKHSLVSYGEKNGITYIVVTDYADSYKKILMDTSDLYQYYFNNYGYHNYKINFNINIENSKQDNYNVDIDTLVYLKNDYDKKLLNYKYEGVENITFLNKKGNKLGKVSIYYDNELIKEIDVKLNKDIEYKTKPYLWFIIVILVIVTILVVKKLLKHKKHIKIKYVEVKNKSNKKTMNKKINEEVEIFIKEENGIEKKLKILENTIDINLFFNTLKSIDNVDKVLLEKAFIDRCFQNIDFENINELKCLYTKFKLYKNEMNNETIKYYNKLFKYCIKNYVD